MYKSFRFQVIWTETRLSIGRAGSNQILVSILLLPVHATSNLKAFLLRFFQLRKHSFSVNVLAPCVIPNVAEFKHLHGTHNNFPYKYIAT